MRSNSFCRNDEPRRKKTYTSNYSTIQIAQLAGKRGTADRLRGENSQFAVVILSWFLILAAG